jgi:hypothetical protein
MSRSIKHSLVLAAFILISFAATAVNAATLVIGANNDLTRYPFGRDPGAASAAFPDFGNGGVYQQVFSSTAFPGPVTITQIALASKSNLTSGPGIATYDLSVGLSSTAVGPGGLSTTLGANRGADFAEVFSGVHIAAITANDQFDVIIDVTPFRYDPANGNLLLEVRFNAPTQFSGSGVLYFNAGFSPATSRAANPSGAAGGAFTDGFGALTRFTTIETAQVLLGDLEQTFDGTPKNVTVTTSPPGLAVTVTYDGSTTSPINAGTYAVAATINDPNFTGQISGNLVINKADQPITFEPLPNRTFGDADFAVVAAAASGLPVNLVAAGNCTMVGAQVHLTGAGTCDITAAQAGDANFNPAPPVTRNFLIAKANQQITFGALPDRTFGDADFDVSATASSDLGISFSATGNCALAGATVHLTGAGACTVTATQEGNANFNPATPVAHEFSIAKADQQITFGALPDRQFGSADFDVSATSSSDLTVSFAATGDCTLAGATVHLTGAGTCTITASQEGNANFNPATPVARTFSIAKADQQITFAILPDRQFGSADFDVSATASSGLEVSLSASHECTISGATVHLTGAGICTIAATQEGNANFNPAATVFRTFIIAKADQQIAFGVLPDRTFGDADFNVSATASSDLAVSFAAAGNCTIAGATVHLTGGGACTITASQPGDANHNPAAEVNQSFNIATAATAVAVTSSLNPSEIGRDVTFTATVTSTVGTPTGTVQFRVDGVQFQGPLALDANGVATVSTSTLTEGLHTIVAIYGGDTNFGVSTGALAGGQLVNDTGITIRISDAAVSEGAVGTRNANFTVSMSRAADIPLTVLFQTAADTAVAPADYIPIPDGTLTIPAGATSGTITVRVRGDAVFEGNETFFVNITGTSFGGAIDDHAIGTIVDDDVHTSDFDGDGVADSAVWGSDTVWRSINSSNDQPRDGVSWGNAAEPLNDIGVPGDYDGDGVTDSAVWRPAEGNWYIVESSTNAEVARNWGLIGDIPVPDDYDGDGKTDVAVWRPTDGNWYILNSSDGAINTVHWGLGSLGDIPVRGHFGGTNGADYAVFRRPEGNWYILNNDQTSSRVEHWGQLGDVLVPGDYDGDGKTDIAVWRRPEGNWFIHNSSNDTITIRNWGRGPLSDVPVPADYDGDGRIDIAVWRASEGNWYIIGSATDTPFTRSLGQPNDVPVPAAHLLR